MTDLKSSRGAPSAIVRSAATVRREIGASREKARGARSQSLGILMNRLLQLGEDQLGFVGALGVDSCSTQFSNAIVDAAGARNHDRKISASGSQNSGFNCLISQRLVAAGQVGFTSRSGGYLDCPGLELVVRQRPGCPVERSSTAFADVSRASNSRPFSAQTQISPVSCQAPQTPHFRLTPFIYSRYISRFFAGSPNSN